MRAPRPHPTLKFALSVSVPVPNPTPRPFYASRPRTHSSFSYQPASLHLPLLFRPSSTLPQPFILPIYVAGARHTEYKVHARPLAEKQCTSPLFLFPHSELLRPSPCSKKCPSTPHWLEACTPTPHRTKAPPLHLLPFLPCRSRCASATTAPFHRATRSTSAARTPGHVPGAVSPKMVASALSLPERFFRCCYVAYVVAAASAWELVVCMR